MVPRFLERRFFLRIVADCLQRRPTLNFHFKTMALTTEEVRKIASLARLRFCPEEEAAMAVQLGNIVDYIDQLQRLDAGKPDAAAGSAAAVTEAPPAPGLHPAPEADDLPGPCLPRETFLANAPAARDGFLLVPEVRGTSRPAVQGGEAASPGSHAGVSDDEPL
jgi:aspartyl-tRNA(Asn)/glutamyl-tRNA(Gln) amidotransferase subunit C